MKYSLRREKRSPVRKGARMKHTKGILFFILFFLLIGGVTRVSAQEATGTGVLPSVTDVTAQDELSPETDRVQEEVIQKKAEYILPYPGMLPDHPLYNLKRMRDYILERLIADPIKKSEFYILQADKRLQMGVYLTAQGKNALAESTISKGEKYLEKAQGIMSGLKANGTLPSYIIEKYENALGKHQEVIGQLIVSSEEPLRSGLAGSMSLVSRLINEVGLLK
jgi:hypothetical protein